MNARSHRKISLSLEGESGEREETSPYRLLPLTLIPLPGGERDFEMVSNNQTVRGNH
jgi:hypothetical protein